MITKPDNIEQWERETGLSWRIEGVGHEILAIPVTDLRRVAEIPKDVTLAKVVPPPYSRNTPPQVHETWIPEPAYLYQPPMLYLHISHRYCIRCGPGVPMVYGDLDSFLQRYKDLTELGR